MAFHGWPSTNSEEISQVGFGVRSTDYSPPLELDYSPPLEPDCSPPLEPLYLPLYLPSLFQAARTQVEEYIVRIVSRLNAKKVELFAEINSLEREFADKQQQQQRELNKLNSLKSQTEDLRENNLLTIQHKLIQEIEQEIEALTLSSKPVPDYNINVLWGFSNRDLVLSINNSKIEKVAKINTNSCVSYLEEYPNSEPGTPSTCSESDNEEFPVLSRTNQTYKNWILEDNTARNPIGQDTQQGVAPLSNYPCYPPRVKDEFRENIYCEPRNTRKHSYPDSNWNISRESNYIPKGFQEYPAPDSNRRQDYRTDSKQHAWVSGGKGHRSTFDIRGNPDSDPIWPRANDDYNWRS